MQLHCSRTTGDLLQPRLAEGNLPNNYTVSNPLTQRPATTIFNEAATPLDIPCYTNHSTLQADNRLCIGLSGHLVVLIAEHQIHSISRDIQIQSGWMQQCDIINVSWRSWVKLQCCSAWYSVREEGQRIRPEKLAAYKIPKRRSWKSYSTAAMVQG